MNTRTVPSLAGYTLLETLYTGSRTEVYRAVQTKSQQPVVIKVLRHQYPSFTELVQFRNQHTITRHLNHPAIVSPLALERCGNGYALVMPSEGFISLGTYLQQHPLDLLSVLAIAIQLTDALHYLISQRIIHKDIKPANILIHPETGQIKLIDFSIASLLPKEQQQLINPNILEGTLAYISPEQTGRMNRGIDYRTDFYSFGVTLFELLTGELPFATDDPMELVHSHIARAVVFPKTRQQQIPEMVQAIIIKLMAKNAEDRYQSALGLKHDLERCLHQWKATGEIIPFELGVRDISDRFNLPEKLYGREVEVQTLFDAFERVADGNTEMMLVAGFSGIGKTAVVNEVHKPIVRQRGYFIKGKFDQFNRNIPFSAFVQALQDLIGQLLSESDTQLKTWKDKILEALGEQAQVLIEVIPELEKIIGKQPAVTELSGSAAQNRFNLLFSKFVQVFTTKEHPLVLFLDDLQWADSASLNLLKLLISDTETGYLLVLGAYRDNEVYPAHPLLLTLDEIPKAEATINTITLVPLSVTHINYLVADTLSCDGGVAQPLTELVYQKTKGNPFFTTQFLLGLHGEDLIRFNQALGYWECDLSQVQDAALTDDVVAFMAQQLQKLPEATQEVLKLAACIGNQFDLQTLAVVSEQPQGDTATALWRALQEGFILPQSEVYKFYLSRDRNSASGEKTENAQYRFLHDRVQQAAYSLIPKEQKQTTHYRIGQLLQATIPDEALDLHIFELLSQFNASIDQMTQATEKKDLAYLNLIGGRKAKASAAYETAFNYCQIGIDLLDNQAWETDYQLTLKLYETGAESAYMCGEDCFFEQYHKLIIERAKTELDRLNINIIKIQAYTVKNRLIEALQVAEEALQKWGVFFPQTLSLEDLQEELQETQKSFAALTIEEIVALPKMTNIKSLAAMRLLSSIIATAYIAQPTLFPFIILRMVQWSLQYGNSPSSPYGYACYGILLVNLAKDTKMVNQIGELALQLLEESSEHEIEARTKLVVGSHLYHWKFHFQKSLPLAQESYQIALTYGDLEYVGYSAQIMCFGRYLMGQPLMELEPYVQAYCHALTKLNQVTALRYCQIYWQAILNLRYPAGDPSILMGEAFNEEEIIPLLLAANDWTGLYHFYCNKLILSYFMSNLSQALITAETAKPYENSLAGMFIIPAFYFYESLAILGSYSEFPPQSVPNWQQLMSNRATLQYWAQSSPCNYQHRFDLVEAEYYRVLGDRVKAIELYDYAIAGAKANGYIQEEALANELAAKFYLDWGKETIAEAYMQKAYYCYAQWGAKAKTDHLEANYPQLLRPILQNNSPTLYPLEALASISALKSTICPTTTGTQTSESNANITLDLVSILKASQTISSTINLEELLTQLTQILLHNSGGDRCAIILCEPNQEMQVRASATVNATNLCSVLLKDARQLPIQLIQYVKNSGEMVVMDSPECRIPIVDHDLAERQPASVLCLPLVDRSQLRGILYLENQVTSSVFHPQRLAALQLLATQAAIALENARLYQQAQDYAQQLEESQLQLVQSEKMSALGNLVAGVAHEINNPLGFINGNITEVRHSFNDMTECLQSYRQTFPEPGEEIEALLEDIEIDFLLEDLPNMLDSMKVGCDRIRGISTSLRMFSRADTESKFKANVHDGIDSTLLILKYRLKAKDFRPEIEVIRHYDNLPEIDCFPGQLNQVFMNLLANAIDMFDEIASGQSFEQLQAHPQQITIQTQVVEPDSIEIRIGDNGQGMCEEICSKIFDRKFTTKAVGKGTGLGLAIARQVIVEKHGGRLEVQSKIGQGTEFFIHLPIELLDNESNDL